MRNQELVERVKQRQPGAFDEFYYAFVDRVHRQLYSLLGPDSEIEDVVQLTFVQVYNRIHTFRGDASVSTWLHRVTINVAMSHLRRRQRWFRWDREADLAPLLQPSEPEQPDEIASRSEKLQLLHGVLGRLKPKKRVAFVLYEIEGHTLEEIAELVSAPVPTVAARLRAARQEVRRSLERQLKVPPLKVVA